MRGLASCCVRVNGAVRKLIERSREHTPNCGFRTDDIRRICRKRIALAHLDSLPFLVMRKSGHYFSFIIVVAAALTTVVQGQHKPGDVPVDYSASVQLVGPLGAAATTMKVHIDSYTSESNRTKLLNALRTNGYQAFLPVFRAMPVVGYI